MPGSNPRAGAIRVLSRGVQRSCPLLGHHLISRSHFSFNFSSVELRSARLVVVPKLGEAGQACRPRLRELTVRGSAALLHHSMLVSIVGMALYTGYVFMPQHIMAILHYFEIVQ
ncbi:PREDICTED: uncharacterized protein LOC103775793 [Merops nubicus]|uniref:uncharacterized protein LOC103775793 n=1 Tax=Merops nubicus TaxID=57421 RepID=UPI0004F01D90|nr:PREDICTED: uncharacterized protein LOC103775793 [Merops nubicus]